MRQRFKNQLRRNVTEQYRIGRRPCALRGRMPCSNAAAGDMLGRPECFEVYDDVTERRAREWRMGKTPTAAWATARVTDPTRFHEALTWLSTHYKLPTLETLGAPTKQAVAFKRVGPRRRVLLAPREDVDDDPSQQRLPSCLELLDSAEDVALPVHWAPTRREWGTIASVWPTKPWNNAQEDFNVDVTFPSPERFFPPGASVKEVCSSRVMDNVGNVRARVERPASCSDARRVRDHDVFRLVASVSAAQLEQATTVGGVKRARTANVGLRRDQYLCTGWTVVVRSEPCRSCCAAALHSRVRALYYCETNALDGACASAPNARIHALQRTNHRYRVYQIVNDHADDDVGNVEP